MRVPGRRSSASAAERRSTRRHEGDEMTLNTILCAVDFSEPSRPAMEMAAGMARRFEARLVLLHVVSPPTVPMSDIPISPVELFHPPIRDAGRTLATWRGDAERIAARPVASAVVTGDPATEIVRWTDDHHPDLVVVG